MAEQRSFGRRQGTSFPDARPAPAPLSYGPDDPNTRGTAAERLDRFGTTLRLSGELVGFAGMLLFLLSSIFLRTTEAGTILTQIYIPPVFKDLLTFDSPAIRTVSEPLIPMVGSLAWPLMALAGAIAMFRRRYLLGGLCVGTLLFPWALVGAYLPFGSIAAVLLAGIGVIRFLELRGLKLAITIILGLVVGVPIVAAASRMIDGMIWPKGIPSVTYSVVTAADLDANKTLSAPGTDGAGRPVARVTDFNWLPARTPEQAVAKAVVLAQVAATRGDVQGVVAALQVIEASPIELNSVEAGRVATARNYASLEGAFGPEDKARTEALINTTDAVGSIIRYAGIVLGLFGPFAGTIGGIATRRGRRIEAAEAELAARRAQSASDITAGRRAFGRVVSNDPPPMPSFAAADGTAVIDAMSGRIDIYRIAALVLGSIAILAIGASLLMALPPAASNTAFDAVDLTTAGGTWALGKNLPHQTGLPPLDALVPQWLIGGLVVAAIAYRIRKPIGLAVVGVVLAGLVYWQVNSLFFVDQAHYEASPALFTSALRSELERGPTGASIPMPSGDTKLSVADLQKLAARARAAQGLDAGTANFILAQLDYLDGNPAGIGKHLVKLADRGFASGATTAEDQRVDIMAEWAAANGHPVDAKFKHYNLILPMAAVRATAQPLTIIGLAGAALAALALVLSSFASHRREKLQGLVTEAYRVSR